MRKKVLSAFMLGLLALGTTSTVTSCKDYDGDISALRGDVTSLQGSLADLQSKLTSELSAVNTKIDNLKTELTTALNNKADKQTVQDLADNLANNYYTSTVIDQKLKAVNDLIADLQSKHDADIIAVLGKLDDQKKELTTYIDAADKNLQAQIDVLKAIKADERLTALETMLADYPEVKAQVKKNVVDILALQGDMEDAQADIKTNTASIDELKEKMQKAQADITAVNGRVDALVVCVTKRLTSIYFSPYTYVNGVEAINFAALKYWDWNNGTDQDVANNWLADLAPSTAPTNRIDDGSTTAVYYLNPSGVDEASIKDGLKGLSFIAHKAENILVDGNMSRADEAPVKVVAEKSTLEGGVLTLKLKKNTTEPFTYLPTLENAKYADNFWVVSLKAPLSDEVKTEKEAGQDINVYSDWARLTETVSIPKIHNNIDSWNYVDGDLAVEGEYSHFYSFSEIYTMNGKTFNNFTYDGKAALHFTGYNRQYVDGLIKIPVAYNQSLDLKPFVTVCDNEGRIIDWESYGLSFEFNKLECFNVLDQNQTSTYTDQQKFISIADGVVTPQSISGSKDNRDAMDKTPVIQIVLRDKANNAVVDVRYIILEIVEKTVEPTEIYNKPVADTFDCGNYYVVTLTSEDLNKMAENLGVEGLTSGLEFQTLYSYDSKLYAADGTVIGDVQTKTHGGNVMQADNVVATFDKNNFPLDAELYYNGKKTVTGYIHVKNIYGQYVYYIKVDLTVYFDEARHNRYATTYKKLENWWHASQAHPESTTDCKVEEANTVHGDQNLTGGIWEYLIVNPTLCENEDNAETNHSRTGGNYDTQLVYEIINAYGKAQGQSSEGLTVDDLVTNLSAIDGDEAWFEFDKSRLAEVTQDADFFVKESAKENHKFCKTASEPVEILYHKNDKTPVAILYKKCGQIQLFETSAFTGEGSSMHGFGVHGKPNYWAQYFVDYCDPLSVADYHKTRTAGDHTDYWINKDKLGKFFTVEEETRIHNAIPVVLKARQCGFEVPVDRFVVRFEKPLNYKWLDPTITLQDQMDGGSAGATTWDKWFKLEEAFGRFRILVPYASNPHKEMMQWYGIPCNDCIICDGHKPHTGVNGHKCDIDNFIHPIISLTKQASTMNPGKTITICDKAYWLKSNGDKVVLSEFKDHGGKPRYILAYDYIRPASTNDTPIVNGAIAENYTKSHNFKFYNNSGNAIESDMTIMVPVKIETKWHTWYEELKIIVKETAVTAKKK